MIIDEYTDLLKLENQLCFPLYASSREIINRYTPYLKEIGLTYTQYIVFLVLWEYETISVKDLGNKLLLDSGTLTPLLKKLEKDGYVIRNRDKNDERITLISLTNKGLALRDDAKTIPLKVGACVKLTRKEAETLKKLLDKFINNINEGR